MKELIRQVSVLCCFSFVFLHANEMAVEFHGAFFCRSSTGLGPRHNVERMHRVHVLLRGQNEKKGREKKWKRSGSSSNRNDTGRGKGEGDGVVWHVDLLVH